MRDEAFDLVALVSLVALILTLGYMVILKEFKTTEMYNQSLLEDKNVGLVEGVIIPMYGEYDGTLTSGEVVLMSQIQDWYMPAPKTLIVEGGGTMEITSTIEGEKDVYGTRMVLYVNASGGKRFSIEYHNGTNYATPDDDYFSIKKMR